MPPSPMRSARCRRGGVYYADFSYEQIAEICDVQPGTIAATLAQAREAVRAALEAQDEVMT
jgi:DNA-directed RNA polymerase specialized sigma24 family protein